MTILTRKEVIEIDSHSSDKLYIQILRKETHHDHVIISDKHGTLRWKENKEVRGFIGDNITITDAILVFEMLGYDRNSEIYRKLYRDLGYSLYGYWEVFYWELNNPDSEEYRKEI
jgi:hypothetical protein